MIKRLIKVTGFIPVGILTICQLIYYCLRWVWSGENFWDEKALMDRFLKW